jgi:predicted DNA-binding protein (MmcQ/YjbR family)
MDRKGLEQLIFDTYSVEPDYPWMDTPESAVFRHAANRKWFALVTTVPKSKLGLPGQLRQISTRHPQRKRRKRVEINLFHIFQPFD